MLQSFVKVAGKGPHKILISENSTDDRTADLLTEHRIPFIRKPGATHAPALSEILQKCTTKYALVVDSDILFFKSPDYFRKILERDGYGIMGEVSGDRGGYKLYPRIHPWYMMVNVEILNKYEIKFYDETRVVNTHSEGFFQNVPLQANDGTSRYYDVASTFYEDIIAARIPVYNYKADPDYFKHFEGMSWYSTTTNENFLLKNDINAMHWDELSIELKLDSVNLTVKFEGGEL
jgi:hypothetical protein